MIPTSTELTAESAQAPLDGEVFPKFVWVAVNEVNKDVFKHPSRRVLGEILAPFEKVGRKYRYVIDYEWE
jgi:hypothetical protein